jgi:hypothetical protein
MPAIARHGQLGSPPAGDSGGPWVPCTSGRARLQPSGDFPASGAARPAAAIWNLPSRANVRPMRLAACRTMRLTSLGENEFVGHAPVAEFTTSRCLPTITRIARLPSHMRRDWARPWSRRHTIEDC